MPKIPNNGGIPSNLVWDDLNPPVINECNGLVQIHDKSCDGSCERTLCTELDVMVINEHRNWARLGMNTANVGLDLFKLSIQMQTLVQVVGDMIGEDTLKEKFQQNLVDAMTAIRLDNEEAIRRARFGLGKPGIIGPDGNPL